MGLFIDGLIILTYFIGIIAIGLYVGRRERSLSDFALGGRRVPWWAVMASIIAAETSAATFLGAPGEEYDKRSLAYVQLVIGLIIGRYLVGYIFLKPYYRYKVYTVYDYIGVRFGQSSKNYVSGLFLLMRTLASGTRLFQTFTSPWSFSRGRLS
jgi:Na+/proline symporter